MNSTEVIKRLKELENSYGELMKHKEDVKTDTAYYKTLPPSTSKYFLEGNSDVLKNIDTKVLNFFKEYDQLTRYQNYEEGIFLIVDLGVDYEDYGAILNIHGFYKTLADAKNKVEQMFKEDKINPPIIDSIDEQNGSNFLNNYTLYNGVWRYGLEHCHALAYHFENNRNNG